MGKGVQAPFSLDQCLPRSDIQRLEHLTVTGVVALTCQQCRGNRIAHGTNADLQRTAIAYQAAGVQADAVVLDADRHVWRGKQPTLLGFVEQQVERIDGQLCITRHVGQFGMHLAQHEDGFASRAALGDHRQQVEGDVWVAGQAQVHGLFGGGGHQLGDQVQAFGVDIPCGVAVVAADVVLLRRFAVQQATGLHEELFDSDVRRQAVVAQVCEVTELFVVSEDTLDEGFEKAPLQAIAQWRAAKGKCGIDGQATFGQLAYAGVKCVDEGIGFAQAQRQAHVDMGWQPGQDLLDSLVDGAEVHLGLLKHPWVQELDIGLK
ncbi:hypothetical protein D3C76_507080 [compost metagenome]